MSSLRTRLKLAEHEQRFAIGGYFVGGSVLVTGLILAYLNRPRLLESASSVSVVREINIHPILLPDGLAVAISTSH